MARYRRFMFQEGKMKEYQIRMEGYRLPEEVYHQCLWIVRDMERSIGLFASFMAVDRGELPLQVSSAGHRICAVSRALEMVPAEYRQGIIDSILKRGGGFRDYAHENTWKRWKQRFIYGVAVEMGLV